MAGLGLRPHELEGTVGEHEQRVDCPLSLVDGETVGVEEPTAARNGVDIDLMLIEVDRIPHRPPMPQRDRDVPEPIDRGREVEVDERDGPTLRHHDVLEAEVVVAHERPAELARQRTVAPHRAGRRTKVGDGFVVAALERRHADQQLVARPPGRKGWYRHRAGLELEDLDISLPPEHAGRAVEAGPLQVGEEEMHCRCPGSDRAPDRVPDPHDASFVAQPTSEDLLDGFHRSSLAERDRRSGRLPQEAPSFLE